VVRIATGIVIQSSSVATVQEKQNDRLVSQLRAP
jgi:hypothetical protein